MKNYNRRLQVLYINCKRGREFRKFDVENNPHMPSIFIEEHTTFHEVKCRPMKCNLDSQTNVDDKSIHPKIFRIYHILTTGSYSITNKTDKQTLEKKKRMKLASSEKLCGPQTNDQ